MELKTKDITYIVVEHSNFENFVNHIYGVNDFSVSAEEEASSSDSLTFQIGKYDWDSEPHDDWDKGKLDEFYKTGYGTGVRLLLVDMFQREIIPAGNYLIGG